MLLSMPVRYWGTRYSRVIFDTRLGTGFNIGSPSQVTV